MSTTYQPTCTPQTAQARAAMYATLRQFFAERQVLEVQTPVMSQAGNTDIFLQSVSSNVTVGDNPTTYYLHTSPEFAMKRLLAAWQVPMYQICPVFRDNEIGSRHNIEFTMLEWYRPNFSLDELAKETNDLVSAVLGYPVISMDPAIAHPGSRKALIGETPTAERQHRYSPEQNVTPQTPPTFIFHAVDDPSVPVDNALVMFNALRAHQVPTELHLFAEGKHGFGIRGTRGLPAAEWPQLAMNWIASLAEMKK